MQQFQQQQGQPLKTRKAVLIFLKQVGPPVVLYVENPEELYNEITQIITKASPGAPRLLKKEGKGPLKNLSILDTQIAGVAIQEESYV